jgi:uncharacterized RDD family membrane protein YckC
VSGALQQGSQLAQQAQIGEHEVAIGNSEQAAPSGDGERPFGGRVTGLLARGATRVAKARPVYAPYAGFVSRAMAMVLDLLAIATTLTAIGIANDFVLRTSGLGQLLRLFAQSQSWLAVPVAFLLSPGFELLVTLGFGFFYFACFYSIGGATLGKHAMGLRVVAADGRRISVPQAALRTLGYAVSALALYLGFLAVLVDDRRRGWHDRLARTAVVHKPRAGSG